MEYQHTFSAYTIPEDGVGEDSSELQMRLFSLDDFHNPEIKVFLLHDELMALLDGKLLMLFRHPSEDLYY